jgi:hypothetical protein
MEYRRIYFKDGVDVVVVALDICSSASIVESLNLAGDSTCFTDLLSAIKRYLAAEQKKLEFDPYKFTGDGWILLFPGYTNGPALVVFLRRLCTFYAKEFRRRVMPNLIHAPRVSGLSFGVDKGPLIHMTMYGRREYIGRALTVACRLQSPVKDRGSSHAYRALVTSRAFREHFAGSRNLKVSPVSRILENINNNAPFRCRKIVLARPNAP